MFTWPISIVTRSYSPTWCRSICVQRSRLGFFPPEGKKWSRQREGNGSGRSSSSITTKMRARIGREWKVINRQKALQAVIRMHHSNWMQTKSFSFCAWQTCRQSRSPDTIETTCGTRQKREGYKWPREDRSPRGYHKLVRPIILAQTEAILQIAFKQN